MALVIIYQPRRRINHQGGTADDQHIRSTDIIDGRFQRIHVQTFFVQDHVRFNLGAAGIALGHAGGVQQILRVKEFMAAGTVIAMDAAVQFQHVLAAGRLMQAVDILRDDGFQFSRPFQFRQLKVSHVGFGCQHQHLLPVKAIELFRVFLVKSVA